MTADAPWGEAVLGESLNRLDAALGNVPSWRCCCPHSKGTGEGDWGHFCAGEVPTLLCSSVKMNGHIS